ncbi:hypothetical protein, partial [Actinophytocola sp.]|uniref:hypothetical protein n=1 Tax=Actinophytocola sp. TaxID=1872138 RepID=UPI002ED11F4A
MAVGQIAGDAMCNLLPRLPARQVEWLELDRADATTRFVRLTSDLSRGFNSSGNGKRITCGHAFAGVGTAVAWAALCRDPLAGAAKRSVDTFARRWRAIRDAAPAGPCHYVSLGPGDGRKDAVLVADLS